MLLRLEEKWQKWFFCSEDLGMDPTVWPAFTFGHTGVEKKTRKVSILLLSPKKKKWKCFMQLHLTLWRFTFYSFVFCKRISNFFPLIQDGFLGIWFIFLGNRCMFGWKGWDWGNFPQLELNFLMREWASEEMFPDCGWVSLDLEEIQGLKKLKQEK